MNRRCKWCRGPIASRARRDALTCGKRCRQTLFRLRRRRATHEAFDRPLRFAYADPPYPGTAFRYYGDQPSYAGEVDHEQLVEQLELGGFDGWALSTSAKALRDVLPLCPEGARVCAWTKPIGAAPKTNGLHNCWEPLIVVRGRQLEPGVRDWLRAMPARGGGDLPGRKPLAFCGWLFDCLGMLPGDELVDLFPGSGIVGRAWSFLSRAAASDAYRAAVGDASTPAPGDASQAADNDGSRDVVGDASSRARGAGSVARRRRRRVAEVLADASPGDLRDASLLEDADTSPLQHDDVSGAA